jgi:Uncharacterized protein conserved in bacteria
MTQLEALEKLKIYCNYRDRCHQEVRSKLLSMKIYGDMLEEVMATLIEEGYLNELRYAESYVRGKYRINKWGKNKIRQGLKLKGVSDYCIKKGLAQIDQEGDYVQTLEEVLSKYINQRMDKDKILEIKNKAYSHGIRKGYESSLIRTTLDSIMTK